MPDRRLELFAIDTLPQLHGPQPPGPLLVDGLRAAGIVPRPGDVLVVAQKFVSKSEGRLVELSRVTPSPEAQRLAAQSGKDPRLVEVILRESRAIVRAVGPHLIMEHRLGFISANAAVDQSNSGKAPGPEGESDWAVLLPEDPDRSARAIRVALAEAFDAEVAVIISDSHGRPFRVGAIGVAVGAAGLNPILSYKGRSDLDGRVLRVSEEAVADELASAASLLMGQANEACPAVLIRGYRVPPGDGSARDLVRPREQDLFR